MNKIVELVLLIILLALAAVTAASEIAVIAASRIKLKRLAMTGAKSAKIILKILEVPERFFGTILVTNNVIDTLIAVLVTIVVMSAIGDKGGWGIAIATILGSFLIIVFEVTAKTLAATHPNKIAFWMARPLKALIFVSAPVVKIFEVITTSTIKLIGAKKEGKASLVTEEEVRALIKIGEAEGGLHKEKYAMLSKVFEFSDAVVENVMTPKADIVAVDANSSVEEIVDKVLETGYSRFPVYKNAPCNIVGVINMKDLLNLLHNRELVVLQDIIYPIVSVTRSKKITELLKEFQKGHTHLAVVLDGKGCIEGIVTLEDLLEEIVGDIKDEYDIRGGSA